MFDTMHEPITAKLSPDGMRAELTIAATADPAHVRVDDCLWALREAGVVITAEIEARVKAHVEAFDRADRDHILVLRGTPPTHGENGRWEWAQGCDPNEHHAGRVDQTGRVDYYDVRRFVTVEQGQVIARLVPPTEGEHGLDLRGNPISPKPGQPAAVRLPPEIIEVAADGRCTAQIAGVLDCRGDQVDLNPVLDVRGRIDFDSGNVRFAGDVAVSEGICDRFEVEAAGSVQVGGTVEAARVRTGRDLVCKAGVAMHGAGSLNVGGDLYARYLNNATAEVAGNVHVENEIIQSDLVVGRGVFVERGAIIGGTLTAARSLRVRTLGSDGELPTRLVLARHLPMVRMLAAATRRLEALDQQLREANEEAQKLRRAQSLTPEQRERLTELVYLPMDLTEQRRMLDEKRQALGNRHQQIRTVNLAVEGMLYANVTIEVDQTQVTFTREVKGPLWIGWSHDRSLVFRIAQGPARPLQELPGLKWDQAGQPADD